MRTVSGDHCSINMDRTIRLIAAAAVVMFCLQNFSDNKADVDIWGNLGFVNALPWSQDFHRTNTYSYTEPDHPWTNHEWLGQYILHHTHVLFGNTGLLLLKMTLGLSVIAMMVAMMTADCRSGPVRFLYLLLIISTMGYGFSTRPHHFTYAIYAAFLLLLRKRAHSKLVLLLVLPLLGIFWANLHGAFFIGVILLTIYGSSELVLGLVRRDADRTRSAELVLCGAALFILASFINPYGPRLWEFIFQSAAKTRPHLSEWAPFNPVRDFYTHPDFIVLSLVTLATVCASKAPRDFTWMLILGVSFAGAMLMRRNIPLFAITAGFIATKHIDASVGPLLSRMIKKIPVFVLAIILCAFILISGYYSFMFNKSKPAEIEIPVDRFPVDVVEFMRVNNLEGHALVFFDWAEYCIWKLHPKCLVFMDGRFRSAYSLNVIDDYLRFFDVSPGWETALEEYDTDVVLVHRASAVVRPMRIRPGWTLTHETSIAALFLRNTKHANLIANIKAGRAVRPEIEAVPLFP